MSLGHIRKLVRAYLLSVFWEPFIEKKTNGDLSLYFIPYSMDREVNVKIIFQNGRKRLVVTNIKTIMVSTKKYCK